MTLLKVTYNVSEEDYIRYLLHHNWRSNERIRMRLTIHLLILIAFLGLTFSMFIEPLYSWNNIILVTVGMILQALIPIFMERRITKAAQKKFRKSYPDGFKPTLLEVTKDTLTLTKSNGIIDLEVGKILTLEEFEDLLIIHTTDFTIMLSQNSFDDKFAYEQFAKTLSEIVRNAKNIEDNNE
ncbi:MAG: hypothetical protein AB8G11_16005 [Saprospiraceae bacterium]